MASAHPAAPPTATVALQPIEAYADTILRGSTTFSDPDGDLQGSSTYRWLVNGSQVATGDVAQNMLLPLDGIILLFSCHPTNGLADFLALAMRNRIPVQKE